MILLRVFPNSGVSFERCVLRIQALSLGLHPEDRAVGGSAASADTAAQPLEPGLWVRTFSEAAPVRACAECCP